VKLSNTADMLVPGVVLRFWELRFEGYNIFNHPNFLNPGSDAAHQGNVRTSGQFGLITGTVGSPDGTTGARQVQVAMKLTF